MTWLIPGGTGQLGIALSRELGNRGELFSSWGFGDLNITRGSDVLSAITSLNPSVIVNCAAWTDVEAAELDPDAAYAVNAQGALNLAIAAKKVGAVFVQISTDYVFSGNSTHPWRENDLLSPISIYGSTKAAGEIAVLNEYAENSYILRTAWLYSPWGKNFAKTMTRLAINGDGEVRVVNDQVGQPTSAVDLAKQIVDLGQSSSTAGTYHGTNSGQGTWFDFAQEIFNLVGADVNRVIPVSSSEYPRAAKRPSYSVLSHDEWARTSLNPMRDWRIALAEAMPAIVSVVKAEE
jgi:dTDP-4-dehydrorhamnose reductase